MWRRLLGIGPRRAAAVPALSRERVLELLTDEKAQIETYDAPLRAAIGQAISCDEVPGGRGDFGLTATNPIPVNGTLGAVTYLTSLASVHDRTPILFHRLGRRGRIEVYEVVSIGAEHWDILFLDTHYPRKSRRHPLGFLFCGRLKQKGDPWGADSALFRGTGAFAPDFPAGLDARITDYLRGLEIPLDQPFVRKALESHQYQRPDAHMLKLALIEDTGIVESAA